MIRGLYANWRLTIAIEPPDPEDELEFKADWEMGHFENVCNHFAEIVNLLELQRRAGAAR